MRRSMRSSLIGLAAGAILLAGVSPSAGAIYENSFVFTLLGGIQSGDSDTAVASDSSYSFRVAYALTPKIEIEAGYGRFDTTRDITGFAGDPASPANQVEFSQEGATEFTYYTLGLTANFLTETDSSTFPFVAVSLGSAEERRDGQEFCIDLITTSANQFDCDDVLPNGQPVDPNVGPSQPREEVSWQRALERKDTGTLLTLGAGARTFFGEWFALRYEARYFHHDTFEVNQDAFEFSVGASFVVGGRR